MDNAGYGINIQENSYARIGFTAPIRGTNGNTIENNAGLGIVVHIARSTRRLVLPLSEEWKREPQ